MFCEKCGKEIADNAAFCENCGAAIKKEINWFEGENKIILFIIILIGGRYGLHNFVLGETKKGIVKIVACLLFAGIGAVILTAIDVVKIARGTYKIDTEAFF